MNHVQKTTLWKNPGDVQTHKSNKQEKLEHMA